MPAEAVPAMDGAMPMMSYQHSAMVFLEQAVGQGGRQVADGIGNETRSWLLLLCQRQHLPQ